MTKYWFNLNPETFLWKTENKILLYNTTLKECIIFENNEHLDSVITQFQDLENMYCLELMESEIKSNSLKPFIDKVVNSSFGCLEKAIEGEKKPAFFVPVLKLQGDLNKIKYDNYIKTNKNMLSYLHEVEIYLNVAVPKKSINSSFLNTKVLSIPFVELISFLQTFTGCSSANTININGENFLLYPELGSLINELNKIEITKVFHLYMKYFPEEIVNLNFLKTEQYALKIVVEPGFDPNKLFSIVKKVKDNSIKVEWQFLINSEPGFEEVEIIIGKLKLDNYEIKPIFNGTNLDFFEKNIFLNEEDIQHSQLTKREIFAHQVINTNDFGKLIIMADGNVYANLSHSPLGTIHDPINEMLYNEMVKGTSWRRIRNVEPCNNCIYQWLCPSPSNYELAIGKQNLCQVL